MKKPRALRPGDTIALIRPASRLDEKKFQHSLRILRDLGYCALSYPKSLKVDSFFAASDEDRAREFLWAMTEPGIHAVLAARGGYGSVRLIQDLSRDRNKMNKLKSAYPRIFVGYSDCTYLHQWIHNQLQWVSFHGPLTGYLSKTQLSKLIFQLENLNQQKMRLHWKGTKLIQSGRSQVGCLVGGNLSLFESSGPACLPRRPFLLAIEEVNENHYRIDRMLRRLIDAGYSKYVVGILLGSFKNCGRDDRKVFSWKKIEQSLFELCRGPILAHCPFGHGMKTQVLLGLGVRAQICRGQLEYLEGLVAEDQ